MSEERTTLEIIAPTVEDAITKGLNDLGLPEEAVDVEILDNGSRGIFGIGARQARIRLTIKKQPAKPAAQASQKPESEPRPQPAPVQQAVVVSPGAGVSSGAVVSSRDRTSAGEAAPAAAVPLEKDEAGAGPVQVRRPAAVSSPENEEHDLRVARETVTELLDKMGVQARVTSRFIEAEDPKDEQQILVEIHGNDLSILIGRKSETLNAIQYISSLIVGKELGRWAPLQIDVEGYRQRRERILRQLARRMADQAISTGKRQVLEPMPANERRVIHMELRDHDKVITESIGEEPNRKVTISLKK